jgi:hypothetical protein
MQPSVPPRTVVGVNNDRPTKRSAQMTTITDLGPPTQLVEAQALGHLGLSRDATSIDSLVAVGSERPTT